MNELPSDGQTNPAEIAQTVSAEQLRRLIDGATKTPKVIAGARRGVFCVNAAEIENFFNLIDQRVNEQSQCSLERFEANIFLDDGTSRKLPSIQEFRAYATPNSALATVVSLHIVLLISFPDVDYPEKQEIDITIRASNGASQSIEVETTEDSFRFASDKVQIAIESSDTSLGLITYAINHTRISWGLDIENHLKGHIDKLVSKPSATDRLLKRVSGPLNLFTTLFVGLYLVNLIIDGFFYFLYKSEAPNTPENIIELASNYLVNGHIAKYIVASMVVGVVVLVLFSVLVSRMLASLSKPQPSFIILSESDEKRRSKRIEKHNKRWMKLVAVASLNVVVALVIALAEERASNFFQNLFG